MTRIWRILLVYK